MLFCDLPKGSYFRWRNFAGRTLDPTMPPESRTFVGDNNALGVNSDGILATIIYPLVDVTICTAGDILDYLKEVSNKNSFFDWDELLLLILVDLNYPDRHTLFPHGDLSAAA